MNPATVGQLDPSIIDADGQIVSGDVPCRRCEYNLRTLAVSAVCPECGSSVAESLRPDTLEFADARWLRRMRLGTRLMLAASVVFVLSLVLGFLSNLVWFVFVLAGIGWLAGVWWATVREPQAKTSTPRVAGRWIGRLTALVLVVNWSLQTLAVAFVSFRGLPFWATATIMISFYFLPLLSPMMICLYFLPISRRGREPGLGRLNIVIAVLLGFDILALAVAIIMEQFSSVPVPVELVLLTVAMVLFLAFVLGLVGFVGHLRMIERAIAWQTARD